MPKGITINPSKMDGTGQPVVIPSAATVNEIRQGGRDLARQLMDQNDGDQTQAKKDFAALCKQRPDLADLFAKPAVPDWFALFVADVAGNERERIARRARNDDDDHPGFGNGATNGEAKDEWTPPENLGAGMAARRHNDVAIFNWQIPHFAKKIGDATRKDIGQAISHFATSIERTTAVKAMLEDLTKRIAKAPVDKVIRDIIEPQELERLFRRHGVV